MASHVRSAALAVGALAALAAAPAGALDVKLDLSAQSAYVWRGMLLDDRPVFQPSLTLSEGPLEGSVWTNFALRSDDGTRGEPNEIDYWLAYTLAGEDADWTLTWYEYTFPHTDGESTREVWASVTLKNLPLAPSFTAIRDVQAIDGWYFLLSGSQSLGVLKARGSDGLLLTLNVGHGNKAYCRGYFPQVEHDGVTDYGARLDWPVKLGPGMLTLDVQYTDFTEKDVYTPGFMGKRANLAGGLAYSLEF